MRIGIVDYGVGNLGSLRQAMTAMQIDASFLMAPDEIDRVDRLVLPGVGNFADCAARLETSGWADALKGAVITGRKPLLGICVGMQLLATDSAEGATAAAKPEGLDLIPGHVRRLTPKSPTERVPHVGWNSVAQPTKRHALFAGIEDATDFYFVHSYAFHPDDPEHGLAVTTHGAPFAAAVGQGHVMGTQFHPEKSSRAGLRVLRNFVTSAWD